MVLGEMEMKLLPMGEAPSNVKAFMKRELLNRIRSKENLLRRLCY